MKTSYGYPCILIAIVVLVVVSVLFAGCSSQPAGQPATPQATQPAGIPASQAAATATTAGLTTASLPYGVSLSVPAGWTRDDSHTSDVRDYGMTTVSIARFTSPGDASSSTTLSIDIDQNPGSDFEGYFNRATLAVEKLYDTADHGHAKSGTLQVSGYKSYELDFDSLDVKGSYVFTSTDKGMYIFAFKGQNKPVPVHMFEGQITDMIKSITITPTGK